jgi:hypothetical protein
MAEFEAVSALVKNTYKAIRNEWYPDLSAPTRVQVDLLGMAWNAVLHMFSFRCLRSIRRALFRKLVSLRYVFSVTLPPCRNSRILDLCTPVASAISRSENASSSLSIFESAATRPFSYTLTFTSISWSMGPCSGLCLNSLPQSVKLSATMCRR